MADEVNLPLPPAPKNSWTIPLLLILSIFSLAISGYLFWQNQQLQKQLAELQKPSPSPTALAASPSPAAESPDPTAAWKSYSNAKYGYTIKIPQDWKINSSEPGSGEVPLNNTSRGLVIYPSVFSNSSQAQVSIFIETDGTLNLSQPTYEKWLQDRRKPFFKVDEIKNINLNSIDAVSISGTYDGYGYPAQIRSILFPSLDKQIYYSILITEATDVEKNDRLDLILSTFKFTP